MAFSTRLASAGMATSGTSSADASQSSSMAALVPLVNQAKLEGSPLEAPQEKTGVQSALGVFDPFGFSRDGDVESFKRRCEPKLKHGCIAPSAIAPPQCTAVREVEGGHHQLMSINACEKLEGWQFAFESGHPQL